MIRVSRYFQPVRRVEPVYPIRKELPQRSSDVPDFTKQLKSSMTTFEEADKPLFSVQA